MDKTRAGEENIIKLKDELLEVQNMLKVKQFEIEKLKQEVARQYKTFNAENLTIMQLRKSAKWHRNKQHKSHILNESEYSSDSQEEVAKIVGCTKCNFVGEHDFQLSTHLIKNHFILNYYGTLRYQCKICAVPLYNNDDLIAHLMLPGTCPKNKPTAYQGF